MISRAVCTTLDHVAKQARFNCDNELDRLNYSIYFALSFFLSRDSRSGWSRFSSTSASRTERVMREARTYDARGH